MVSLPAKLPLAEAMATLEVTVQDLKCMTGLNTNTVRRAVMGGRVKTNITCAERIADALGMTINEINWPSGLTYVGRPALTGVPTRPHHTKKPDALCPDCDVLLPLSKLCDCA